MSRFFLETQMFQVPHFLNSSDKKWIPSLEGASCWRVNITKIFALVLEVSQQYQRCINLQARECWLLQVTTQCANRTTSEKYLPSEARIAGFGKWLQIWGFRIWQHSPSLNIHIPLLFWVVFWGVGGKEMAPKKMYCLGNKHIFADIYR